MKWIQILIIIVLGATVSGAAYAWTDDFESYLSGGYLTSPWVNSNINVLDGYTGHGAARYGYGEWGKYSEYRPAEGVGLLTAQLYNAKPGTYGTLDYGVAQVGLSSGPIAGDGQLTNWGNPVNYISVMALHATEKSSNTLYFDVTDPDGTNFHRTKVEGLAWDQWYDVKIAVSDATSTGYYRPTGSANWILMDSFTQPTGFPAYNYAGICSSRLGTIDNITSDVSSPGAIGGTVTLQNFTPGSLPIAARIQLTKNSVLVRTEDVILNADGSYTLSGVPVGAYSVAIKVSEFLRQVVPNVVVYSDVTATCNVSLTSGDVNGDNAVNAADAGPVIANLDQAGNQ